MSSNPDSALISFIDLTSLNETDSEESIASLCQKAVTSVGGVAAVCVYPRFVKQVAAYFQGSAIKIATVANFPQGIQPLNEVLESLHQSIEEGAEELDVVFPYQAYMSGGREDALSFVEACKEICAERTLKVILETAVLKDITLIAEATADVAFAGADFIKTSTGKLAEGATLEAAEVILLTIKALGKQLKRSVGIKVAGGIREPQQAREYWELAKDIMGAAWVTPKTFRIGASQLVDKLIL